MRRSTPAERGFHKSLSTLRRLQKDRGFVPHSSENAAADSGFGPQPDAPTTVQRRKYSAAVEARWAESVKYGDFAFDDYEVKDLVAATLDHMHG
jgi:hypothetical protein